ncbi:hypothetical protein Cgig2_033485 [Carnegiea gigantea]|uniref:Endonuclease/exonuclease/phosphatase domain-containing protein n=1 Tax=Carnegiea gigantea TaxID=171969 RepID=A0A9Q1GLD4_9CARY|nr:hypothetical protein Cgig2_033485 [Carnegiea gigantea]
MSECIAPRSLYCWKLILVDQEPMRSATVSGFEISSEWRPGATKVEYGSFRWIVLEAHEQFITMEISTGAVYANPHPSNRGELWDKLESWASRINRPWPMAGDFNETRSLEERDHSGPDMARRCSKFNNWIENNALIDIGFSGPKYTWVRGLSLETRKCARLDCAVYDMEWRLKFQEGGVKHLVQTQSDHAPILISISGVPSSPSETKPFCLHSRLFRHMPCKHVESLTQYVTRLIERSDDSYGQAQIQNASHIL